MCVVARREVGARAPAAGDPRVGGARRNKGMRARSKSARRLHAQVVAEGGERREGRGEGEKEEGKASVGALHWFRLAMLVGVI